MHLRHVRTLMSIAALALTVAGCGGGDDDNDGGSTGPSTSSAIDVRDNSYSPSATTVPAGTTVTWTWRGQAAHDVTFSSTEHSEVKTSGTYQRQFTTAGTFDYHCTIHGSAMSGRVTVQ